MALTFTQSPAPAPAAAGTHPTAAVEGLRWLAEAARDVGVDVEGLGWDPYTGWRVHVATPEGIDALADALGLSGGLDVYGSPAVAARRGRAWDMSIEVYGPWRSR